MMKWAKMHYQIPQFYQTTAIGVYTQNIWITHALSSVFTLFS
jgi:hypothetical protein